MELRHAFDLSQNKRALISSKDLLKNYRKIESLILAFPQFFYNYVFKSIKHKFLRYLIEDVSFFLPKQQ